MWYFVSPKIAFGEGALDTLDEDIVVLGHLMVLRVQERFLLVLENNLGEKVEGPGIGARRVAFDLPSGP